MLEIPVIVSDTAPIISEPSLITPTASVIIPTPVLASKSPKIEPPPSVRLKVISRPSEPEPAISNNLVTDPESSGDRLVPETSRPQPNSLGFISLEHYFNPRELDSAHDRTLKLLLQRAIASGAEKDYVDYFVGANTGLVYQSGRQYYVWDKKTRLWRKDTEKNVIHLIFTELRNWCEQFAIGLNHPADLQKLAALAKRCRTIKFQRAIFPLFKNKINNRGFEDSLDRASGWIPTNDDHVVNMFTLEHRLRTPYDLFTRTISARYLPDFSPTDYEAVRSIILRILGHNLELTNFLLQALALSMAGSHIFYPYLILRGSDRSGKIEILRLVRTVLGSTCYAQVENTNNATEQTPGLRLVTKFYDKGRCDLNGIIHEFKDINLLVALCNASSAMIDHRISPQIGIVPLSQEFDSEELNQIGQFLRTPNAINGFFTLCVQVASLLNHQDIQISDTLTQLFKDQMNDICPYSTFIRMCCVLGPAHRIEFEQLYAAYAAFMGPNCDPPRKFSQHLIHKFGIHKLKSGLIWYVGIDLNQAPSL